MKILVTGGSGLLGRYLSAVLPDAEFTWFSTMQPWTRHRMDVRDRESIDHVFAKVKPNVIVHGATVGDVDWCERHYTAAESVVVDGAMNVRRACEENHCALLYLSTNAVFGGDEPPYGPGNERKPVNRYGSFRKRAEDVVVAADCQWAIARLFLLYGWEPKGARGNWATKIVRSLCALRDVELVSDRHWQPTYAGDAAEAIKSLIGERGFWHAMGADRVTLHGFGEQVAESFGYGPERVKAIRSGQLPPAIAPRPVDTSYDPEAANTLVLPGIKQGLAAMRGEPCGHACGVVEPYGWVPEAGCPLHD